ncbi:MAG: lipid IV(A) 3-deoxy-D-manno-octulosonic acid transferase [Gammaproteobacteria bacterium]|nr:lipid IV(A) 3-deoxy-D-manno-octulosonic acid transferase [Gammaproteobacteria bacterium]
MRAVYLFLLYLIFPFIWLRLLWRARKAPAYAKHWAERLGQLPFQLHAPSIWIHATSLGETIAATPIVLFLRQQFPDISIVITSMTPTGRAKAQVLEDEKTHICYVPYDYPFAVKRFFRQARPGLAIFIETELWPTIIEQCAKENIPSLLVNARLSECSWRGYRRVAGLARAMLQQISSIAAQTQAEAVRFISLGAHPERVQVTGSLKFDLSVPEGLLEKAAALRQHYQVERPVFIAASTHEGEDKLVLDAFLAVRQDYPALLLVIVPRHPERFDAVARLCEQTHLKVVRRSQGLPDADTAIYVGDTLGELLLLYATADIAFIGGSLVAHGGHNPLEPAVFGVPILTGPHVFNFLDIVRLLRESGGLEQVSAENLASALMVWLQDPVLRREKGRCAKRVLEKNRGALMKQLEWISKFVRESQRWKSISKQD